MRRDLSTDERRESVEHGLGPCWAVRGQERPRWGLVERMAHYGVPGVSVAVIDRGELAWARGYGTVAIGSTDAVTAATRFQAASISKPVAALGALRLVERGHLSLDADIVPLLRRWRLPPSPYTRGRPVTLRGLLTHSAGLGVHGYPGYPAGAPLPSLEQILDGAPPAVTGPTRVEAPPGAQWRYSGGGYSLLQLLIEDRAGAAFAPLMADLVLGPAGMRTSSYRLDKSGPARPDVAQGHRADGATVSGGWHHYPESAAAGLWSTAADLASFATTIVRAVQGGGIISPHLGRAMIAPQVSPAWGAPGAAMGLGLAVEEREGQRYFSHSGSNAGYRCHLIASADGACGAAIMTCSDNGDFLITELLQAVADTYEWPGFEPPVIEAEEADPELSARCVGVYASRPGYNLTVSTVAGGLTIRWPATAPVALVAGRGGCFAAPSYPLPIRFEHRSGGPADALLLGTQRLPRTADGGR